MSHLKSKQRGDGIRSLSLAACSLTAPQRAAWLQPDTARLRLSWRELWVGCMATEPGLHADTSKPLAGTDARLAAGKDELREQVDETSAQEAQRGQGSRAGHRQSPLRDIMAWSSRIYMRFDGRCRGHSPSRGHRIPTQELRFLSERINHLAPREQLLEI